MTILLFIIILAILIVSHELGHFLVAKKFGIRVDEFGLGFPPRLLGKKLGATIYSLNWIPFGGFVKIFGETPDEESENGPDHARSLTAKSRPVQAAVMFAGVFFNFLLAWLLISLGFMIGLPTPTDQAASFANQTPAKLMIVGVLPESPAAVAGLKAGDELVALSTNRQDTVAVGSSTKIEDIQNYIKTHDGQTLELVYRRGRIFQDNALPFKTVKLTPEDELIGVSLQNISLVRASPPRAVWEGLKLSADLTKTIAVTLGGFVLDAFRGESQLAAVTGPVGMVGLVGDARSMGFIYLLSFTALISLHLAVINLIPFPALDGGRLLFLAIEAVIRRPLKASIANNLNLVGFVLLLALMALVTYSDIVKLFAK